MGWVFTAHDASSEKRGLAALFQVIAGHGNRDADIGQAAAETNRRLRASNRQLDSESDKEKQPPFATLGEEHPITNRYLTLALAHGQTWISAADFDNIQFQL
jgi:hypothetical protein